MKKKLIFDILYVILIVAVIVFIVFVIKFMAGNGKQCMEDPMAYFEGLNEGAECYCMKNGVIYPNTVSIKPNPDYREPQLDDYFNTTEFINKS